jgi:nondiscriminating glutamyl-tRNA synthetase
LTDVNKSAAVFDISKLNWMNGKYIREVDLERIVDLSIPYLESAGYIDDLKDLDREWLRRVIEVARTGVDYLAQLPEEAELFFTDLAYDDPEEASQEFSEDGVELVFDSLKKKLYNLDELTIDNINDVFSEMRDELPVGARTIYHPVRIALTGMTSGPEISEVIYIFGIDEVEDRLDKAIELAN